MNIPVSPAMAQAGQDAYEQWKDSGLGPKSIAAKVFDTMITAAPPPPASEGETTECNKLAEGQRIMDADLKKRVHEWEELARSLERQRNALLSPDKALQILREFAEADPANSGLIEHLQKAARELLPKPQQESADG